MTHENVGPGSQVPEDRTTEQAGYQGGSEWSSSNPYSAPGTAGEPVDPATGYSAGSGRSSAGSITSDSGSMTRGSGSMSATGSTTDDTSTLGDRSTTGQVAQGMEHVKDTAASAASDVKETAVQRGGDVAAVARDEFGRVADEARTQLRSLWGQTSGQLREQASAGKQQLADLLHSLAGELGEMASKAEQNGPLTALARQGAVRGGELSHWLSTSEPGDVLVEIRRFARRRPVLFLAGALAAGVVVGRLSRGLMAQDSEGTTTTTRPQPAARQAAIGDAYGPAYSATGTTHVAGTEDDPGYAGYSTGVLGSTTPPAGTNPGITEPGVQR